MTNETRAETAGKVFFDKGFDKMYDILSNL